MQPIGDTRRVVGTVNFSNIVRGPFQGCNLGDAIDQALMTGALRCAIVGMFSAHVNLHRIQTAFRPENRRGAEVLSPYALGLSPTVARHFLTCHCRAKNAAAGVVWSEVEKETAAAGCRRMT